MAHHLKVMVFGYQCFACPEQRSVSVSLVNKGFRTEHKEMRSERLRTAVFRNFRALFYGAVLAYLGSQLKNGLRFIRT
ncbi:hypothetical protein EMIT051CA3_20419 [Pseudomonas chlororaphis]